MYYIYIYMGNIASCCDKGRWKSDSLTDEELHKLFTNKIKSKSKTDLLLKIEEIKTSRRGNIMFCVLMGASATITIIIICYGAAEPTVASSLIVSVGARGYYASEIAEKNKLLDIYEKELEKRRFKLKS